MEDKTLLNVIQDKDTNIEIAKNFMEKNPTSINEDEDGKNPLYYAVTEKKYEIAEYLLDQGGNPSSKYLNTTMINQLIKDWKSDLLIHFVEKTDSELISRFHIMKKLLEEHKNCYRKLKFLFDNGFSPNDRVGGRDDDTPFFMETIGQQHRINLLKLCLQYGADTNAKKSGRSAMGVCFMVKSKEAFQLLIQYGDKSLLKPNDFTISKEPFIEYMANSGIMQDWLMDCLEFLEEKEKERYQELIVEDLVCSIIKEDGTK